MRATLAIAGREYRAFFQMPLGWIIVALCLLGSGYAFASSTVTPGQPATLREFFGFWWFLLALIAPAISMRLFSEELRSGTFEPLMSSPVSEVGIVLGKYLGAVALLLTCLAPTLGYVAVLEWLSRPDYGPILTGYLGVLLTGMLYLAAGTLFSALTSSQTLAFLASLGVMVGLEVAVGQGASHLPPKLALVAEKLSVNARIADFAAGVLDTSHVAFFVVVSAWLLVLCALALRARRWR
ncbi:ABC transporter permease [soil metagenome]